MKAKHSRTTTPKVRTGCVTCKRRHIKCDETRPHCINCLKNRGHCEGYASQKKNTRFNSYQSCWDSRQSIQRIQSQPSNNPSGFRDHNSLLYFQEFMGSVQLPWLTASSKCNFWEVILPQLVHNNSTLRYAAMAIGALGIAYRESQKTPNQCSLNPGLDIIGTASLAQNQALACYCRSLRLQAQKATTQDAVLLSLLLLHFELSRGNRVGALDHVNHGLALLLCLLTEADANGQAHTHKPELKPPFAAVAGIFLSLALQARTVLPKGLGNTPSLPNLKKWLRHKNMTMESFFVLLSEQAYSPETNEPIPEAFNSVNEFEKHWVARQHNHTKMIKIQAENLRNIRTFNYEDASVPEHPSLDCLGNPHIEIFCRDSRQILESMNLAFLPLFKDISLVQSESQSHLRAIHLRLQCLGAYIFDDPPQHFDVGKLIERTPLFYEYLSVAKLALDLAKDQIQNPIHRISVQCDLSWHLFLLAFWCRDSSARENSVQMLRQYPGQDGLWNTPSLYALAVKFLTIEKANAVEGTLTEQWARLLGREFVFEDGGNRILIRYFEKSMETGEWDKVEEVGNLCEGLEGAVWGRRQIEQPVKSLLIELYCE